MVEGYIDNFTIEQYLALARGNQVSGVVKPKIRGNVNFEIKSQFMLELREDTFLRNKNDDAHEHVEQILDIVSLFNIPGVTHDAVMLRVFPITLFGAAKRWVDRLSPVTVDSWDLLKNPLSKGLGKWHDGSSSRNSNGNTEGITTIVSKLESLGRDMQELKENVHVIQVGCQTCRDTHLDKECPLNEEVKGVKEVKYGEFGRRFPNNIRNNRRFNEGISRYGWRTDGQPSSGERKSSFLDDEKHETKKAEVSEAISILDTTHNVKLLPQKENQNISYYVEPYEPPISFPRRLEQHAEEALVYETMESLKKIGMPIILGRPLLATAHAQVDIFRKSISLEVGNEKVIFKMRNRFTTTTVESVRTIKSETHTEDDELIKNDYDLLLYDYESSILQEKENVRQYWASCDPYSDECDGGGLPDNMEKRYWESMNDSERVDLEWEELSFNDWVRIKFSKVYKFDEAWFNGTSEDEDDLEGILNYLEPKSYDGFIDLDDEAYKERKCRLLGLTYREPPSILIKNFKATRYTIGPEETYTKVKVLGINEVPRTRENIATIRAGLMEKIDEEGGAQKRRRAS
ncbi:hypothetical protein Tco_1283796 [Tanacetum coccineum]